VTTALGIVSILAALAMRQAPIQDRAMIHVGRRQ
jgi:hypothetical protein